MVSRQAYENCLENLKEKHRLLSVCATTILKTKQALELTKRDIDKTELETENIILEEKDEFGKLVYSNQTKRDMAKELRLSNSSFYVKANVEYNKLNNDLGKFYNDMAELKREYEIITYELDLYKYLMGEDYVYGTHNK